MGNTVYILLLSFFVASTRVNADPPVRVNPYGLPAWTAYQFAVFNAGAGIIAPVETGGEFFNFSLGRYIVYIIHYRARFSTFPFVRKCRARVHWPVSGPMTVHYYYPNCASNF